MTNGPQDSAVYVYSDFTRVCLTVIVIKFDLFTHDGTPGTGKKDDKKRRHRAVRPKV